MPSISTLLPSGPRNATNWPKINSTLVLILACLISLISSGIDACCTPNSYACRDNSIRDIVCRYDRECCYSSWTNECIELALLFACPKECGDGVCAMDRSKPEDEENCQTCPEDCGHCFPDLQCDNSSPHNSSITDPDLDSQWHLAASHVLDAWQQHNLFGQNVTVAVVDDGLQWQHEDLQCNYNPSLSFDVDRDRATVYSWEYDNHGTSCAGLVGARDNSVCGRGAAFRSTLVGLRALGDSFSDAVAGRALSWHQQDIDIYSNSWGPYDNGATIERYPLSSLAVKRGAQRGRNGLGNIYVWAAGNGRESGDSSNYDELCNSIYTISVAATDEYGIYSTYSEAGSNILINAPSSNLQFGRTTSGIVTTDRLGFTGYHAEGCFTKFGGTSAAAPLAAGIMALIVQANPQLTWRDMQHILVETAEKTQTKEASWNTNAAGHKFSPNYGFGRIHTTHAIEKAKSWKSLRQTPHLYYTGIADLSKYVGNGQSVQIPEDQTKPLVIDFEVADTYFIVEHVAVQMTVTKGIRGQIVMAVASPSGTVSVLAPGRSRDYGSLQDFPFTSVEFWGEPSVARKANGAASTVWSVILYDKVKDITISTLENLQFSVYGRSRVDLAETFEKEKEVPMSISESSQLLATSYTHQVTLEKDAVTLHWSVDGLYGELTLALEVTNTVSADIGYVTLAFPLQPGKQNSPLDVWVFYFDEEGGHVEDRYDNSLGAGPVLDTNTEDGTDDLRSVYVASRKGVSNQSNQRLFVFERSLNTQDNARDAIFAKDATVDIYWSYGAVQNEGYAQLRAPLKSGKATVKLLESTTNPPNILTEFWQEWRLVILLGALGIVGIIVGSFGIVAAIIYMARKKFMLWGEEPHVVLHDGGESDEELVEEVPPPSAAATAVEDDPAAPSISAKV